MLLSEEEIRSIEAEAWRMASYIDETENVIKQTVQLVLSKLTENAGDVREKVEDILGEAGTQVAETKKLATTEFYKRIHVLYTGSILAAREEERERIGTETLRRGIVGIEALSKDEQGFWKGYWQSMIDIGQSLGGKA